MAGECCGFALAPIAKSQQFAERYRSTRPNLNCGIIRQALIGIEMKKIIIASVAALAVASFAGCMGKGKGKGKEPVAAPAPVYEETYVTKG